MSPSLLIAILDTRRAAALVSRLGAQREAIQASAREARATVELGLGVSSDAEAALEVAVERACGDPLTATRRDLLVGTPRCDSSYDAKVLRHLAQ